MKKVFVASLFFFWISFSLKAQQSYASITNAPLEEALSILESKNEISFSYDNDKVIGHIINVSEGKYTLQQILQTVFGQTNLDFEFIDNKYILLTPKNDINTLEYLCGYVIDQLTEEPVAYATVYNDSKSTGTESDEKGYFKIKLNPSDKAVHISFLGYNTLKIQLKEATSNPCLTYTLSTQNITYEPIILKEYLADGINQNKANTVIIEPQEMNILPGSVEKDILSAISFLPGITSHGESLDGIHVRGGTPDQNLILWDGIPMYHSSHFFGTISAFNPNIIDNVNVLRSGIGSQYGGRVSSVIDIHSRAKITDHFRMGAGFNFTHVHLDLDIPLWKNSSLMISTRRSITDAWNTPTFVKYAEKVFQGTKVEESNFNDPNLMFSDIFKFNDANVKWMMDYGKNKFRFTSLGALNSLNYKADIEEWNVYSVEQLDLRNGGANLSWERQWNDKYKTKLEFTNSEFTYDYDFAFKRKQNNTQTPFSYISNNTISDGGLKWTNDWQFKERQDISFGYHFTENKTSLKIEQTNRDTTTITRYDFNNKEHALFGNYSLNLQNLLQLDIGLRYMYQENLRNNYFEPRIALATPITDRLKLKISTGKHFQFVSQLVAFDINNLGVNNQIWVTANNAEGTEDVTIPVIESNQWMGGFLYQKDNWTLDVEGYVKELAGVTTFSNGFSQKPSL